MSMVREGSHSLFFEKGQAVTEMVIGFTLLVPFLLAIGVVAQYLDIQFKTHEASRYASWERTVWAENKTMAEKTGNVTKSSAEVNREIDALFFNSPWVAIHNKFDATQRVKKGSPLWRDQAGVPLLKLANDEVATDRNINSYHESTGKTPSTNIMDTMEPFNLGGITVGLTAIRRQNFSQITIEKPLATVSFFGFGRFIRNQPENSQDSEPLIRSKSAILSQTWMATDEESMADTISGLVLDGDYLKFVGEPIGALINVIVSKFPASSFPLKEITVAFKNGTRLIPRDQSLVLPNYAIKGRTEPMKTITVDVGQILEWR